MIYNTEYYTNYVHFWWTWILQHVMARRKLTNWIQPVEQFKQFQMIPGQTVTWLMGLLCMSFQLFLWDCREVKFLVVFQNFSVTLQKYQDQWCSLVVALGSNTFSLPAALSMNNLSSNVFFHINVSTLLPHYKQSHLRRHISYVGYILGHGWSIRLQLLCWQLPNVTCTFTVHYIAPVKFTHVLKLPTYF